MSNSSVTLTAEREKKTGIPSQEPLPVPVSAAGRRLLAAQPLFYLSLAFALGIWAASVFRFPFSSAAFAALIALSLLAFVISTPLFIPMSALVFFALGALFGANDRSAPKHDIAFASPQGAVSLEGTVVSVPEVAERGKKQTVSFVLKSGNFFRSGVIHPVREKFSNGAYQTTGKVQVFLHNPGVEIHYGEKLRLKGMLETPKRARNFHTFDYANYLARQGIFKIFRGIGRFSVLRRERGNVNPVLERLNHLRVRLRKRLAHLFPFPFNEIAAALLFGFRKGIPREIQDQFIQTGTAHLLAISGLNISLIGGVFYWLAGFLRFRREVRLTLTIAFVAVYTILAGANQPVVRAGIMGIVVLFGFLTGRGRDLKSAFFFAFLAMLAVNPSALFSASFQLSFAAMASLIFLLPRLRPIGGTEPLTSPLPPIFLIWIHKLRSEVVQTFSASLVVTVGMFPIVVWYFNLISFVGFLANILAIPVSTFAIAATLPLLLADWFSAPLAQGLAWIPLLLYRFELWWIESLSRIPMGSIYLPRPHGTFFFIYYGILSAWMLSFGKRVSRRLRGSLLLSLALAAFLYLAFGYVPRFRLTIFDLGAADSFFISFSNGSNCLVNAGSHFPNDQAYWILRPYLMASGIHKVDGLLLTDLKARHAGGFSALQSYIRFQNVWAGSAEPHLPANKYVQTWIRKRRRIEFLSEGGLIQFGPGSDVTVFQTSQHKLSAVYVRDHSTEMLYLNSLQPADLEAVRAQINGSADILFLPQSESNLNPETASLFSRFSPRFIVSNERKQISRTRRILEAAAGAQILFLEELGAVRFFRSRDSLTFESVLPPLSPKESELRISPAN